MFKRHRRVGKFVCVWSPGYIYINNDLTSSLVPVKQAATQLFFKPNDPPHHHHHHHCLLALLNISSELFPTLGPISQLDVSHQHVNENLQGPALEVTVGLVSASVSRPQETRSSGALRLAPPPSESALPPTVIISRRLGDTGSMAWFGHTDPCRATRAHVRHYVMMWGKFAISLVAACRCYLLTTAMHQMTSAG